MQQQSDKIIRLQGKVQHYAWGGAEFIPGLLGISNEQKKPFAEYWMGAHPSAPSELISSKGNQSLYEAISYHPVTMLGEKVYQAFGELPYLFKVLDVKQMLSIQVHPTKEEAEKGYDAEEAEGIPLNAPHRNYKDRNHKPEVMVALSEFWLLHGFKSKAALEKLLSEVPEFNVFLPYFKKAGVKALYQLVMEMGQAEVSALLATLVKRAIRLKQEGTIDPSHPAWWVAEWYAYQPEGADIDRGIFSIYFFNIVRLSPGQAIFQGAGIPHAYLQGQNIELMANSDNVLRGGLTSKHIDVPELMKHTIFEEVVPEILNGKTVLPGETVYPCPVPDFGISKIELNSGLSYTSRAASLEICIVTDGGALIDNSLVLKRGEAVAMLPGAEYTIYASGPCTIFKAFVLGGSSDVE